ncbi:hypothetical protein BDV06DRAFT_218140 [Aspergillus oleicola]
MGSSVSKPARSATQAAQAASRRQYPKQPSTPSPTTQRSQPRSQPSPPASRPSPASREPKIETQAPTPSQGPVYHSKEQASTEKSSAIDLDGRDPHFAASLRSIGPVTPSPTFSNSSTFNESQYPSSQQSPSQSSQPSIFPHPTNNPALLVISSRQRITREAEAETEGMGRGSFQGRRYLDALTIRQMLGMRDRQGLSGREIERVLRLRSGVVERAGRGGRERGVFGVP